MNKLLRLVFILSHATAVAQSSTPGVEGAYYLQGVMEVGSGFKFNADHSFEFFYSYGALDRVAKGTWEQHGDSLVLNNAPKPPQDFKLVQSKKTGSRQIIIQITNENTMLLSHVVAGLKCADTIYHEQSDKSGRIAFDKCAAQQLSLIHAFWPDRFSVFDASNADYFEFTIEPWIADVAFDHFVLTVKDAVLTGPHPLLEPNTYTYVKEGN